VSVPRTVLLRLGITDMKHTYFGWVNLVFGFAFFGGSLMGVFPSWSLLVGLPVLIVGSVQTQLWRLLD